MDKFTKKRLVVGAIILLVVINISALATMYYTNKIRTKKIEAYNEMHEQAQLNGMHKYFKNELKLTDEQFKAFRKINHSYFSESRKIAENLRIKRYDMINEITNNTPNKKYLDKIAADIGKEHYALKKLTTKHFLELKEICNEEQQKVLHKMFIHMNYELEGDNIGRRNRYGRRNKGNRQDKSKDKRSRRDYSGRR